MEHDRHALTFFTHEPAYTLPSCRNLSVQGGVAVDTHLAFDCRRIEHRSVRQVRLLVESDFWNHENGNALGSLWITFDLARTG